MNLAFSISTKAGTVVAAVSFIAEKLLVCGVIAMTVLVCGVVVTATMTVGTTRASVIGLLVVPVLVTAAIALPTRFPVDPFVQTSAVVPSFPG
jgi:hypothetical protein